MSNTYRSGECLFYFELSGALSTEDVITQFFKKFYNPEKVVQILTDEQYTVYDTIVLLEEWVDQHSSFKTIEGLERLGGIEDGSFYIGFSSSRHFTTAEVTDLYLHVIIPIMTSCDIASRPTGDFEEYHEFLEKTYQKHSIEFA